MRLSLLEPAASDVLSLGDEDLRSLIIKLCEAELRTSGQPLAALSSGGDQNANDGGIDLSIFGSASATAWLPKIPLGIQIKAETMPPSKVDAEMRRHSRLRPEIQNLAGYQGAYIIACGGDNCSFSMLESRKTAMRAALQEEVAAGLFIDFYDADRIARWASSHPSVSLWLKSRAGVPLSGWQGYGRWATHSIVQSDEYLTDDYQRAFFDRADEYISAPKAIDTLRTMLIEPKTVVRLVGLSGMGKTRFAQALFEDLPACSERPLNQSKVVYGDAAATAATAEFMASQLALRTDQAILIVDNCPANLHRRLVPLVQSAGSNTSLLTVDFDIGDDQPEYTHVLRLSPADDDLIETLLLKRAPTLSIADRRRVAEFSGGNARIALALARSSDVSGLAKLRDQDLLDRLFLTDRRSPDEVLRRVARVGSLVYAFDVELKDSEDEVSRLAALAQVSIDIFYEKIGDLLERGLAQQRGPQRAILPQSLAARLADEALDRIPTTTIWRELVDVAPKRLKRSFARRLGLLHTNPNARSLAEKLITEAIELDSGPDDNSDAWYVVEHLAPVAPEAAMYFMERKFERRDPKLAWWARSRDHRLLLALAHDPAHFERAVYALGTLATSERSQGMGDSNLKSFQCLFQISRSGTLASPEVRLGLAARLLESSNPEEFALGVDAVSAALRARIEPMGAMSSFGARTLTTGWAPQTDAEIQAWFQEALKLAVSCTGRIEGMWQVIADRLGDMLVVPSLRSLALDTLITHANGRFWRDGWFGACRAISTIRSGEETVDADLINAHQKLSPNSVDDRFDCWILGDVNKWRDISGRRADSWDKFYEHGRELGKDVANVRSSRLRLLRKSMACDDARSYCLGQGVGQAVRSPETAWAEFKSEVSASAKPESAMTFLRGYFNGVGATRDQLVEAWLDEIAGEPHLLALLAPVQLAVRPIGARGGERLLLSLKARRDEVLRFFSELQLGGISKTIPDQKLSEILGTLSETTEGGSIAIDVLHMRFHGEATPSPTLATAGRALLERHNFTTAQDRDHSITEVARKVLTGARGRKTSLGILRVLLEKIRDGSAVPHCQELLGIILSIHPTPVLDAIYFAQKEARHPNLDWLLGGADSDDGPESRPIASVSDDVLFRWVCKDPNERAKFVAAHISYFRTHDGRMVWSPLATRLMQLPSQELRVLKAFERRFSVGSWTGSAASRYYRRLAMIQPQLSDSNPQIAAWARSASSWLRTRIDEEERRERGRGERFE